jgi:hypothetical protein
VNERQKILFLLLGIVAYFGIVKRQQAIDVTGAVIDTAGNLITTAGNIVSDLFRGERLNNPFNIIKSANAWQGLSVDQSADSTFASFSDPVMGIRAGVKLLSTYFNKYGLNTVQELISKFAPPSENDTRAYINDVATQLGVQPSQPLDWNPATAQALTVAIIGHEQGRVIYDDVTIQQGVQLGFA